MVKPTRLFPRKRVSNTKQKKIKAFDNSLYGSDWEQLSQRCKKRDNFTCKQCGYTQNSKVFRYLHADHIIPLSKNGTNKLSNLQTLCSVCHEKKTNLSRPLNRKVKWKHGKKF